MILGMQRPVNRNHVALAISQECFTISGIETLNNIIREN